MDTRSAPLSVRVNDCDECTEYAEAAREASARGDHSAAVDNRVRIATHETGHAGAPAP
ncbi:hypothetical protein IAG44_30900 [Streptomyces roseirectus]|uniref:Uncharacterized protein n=1 Tax=Streptomyces roseirectus TaxID=2768066 RepID=A0A7H0IKV6_9ACTN|nr:hypothetical protein [Streptomyces roseirectus]QNP73422.1 hypothetical protein IAG44_30900 [Streptomyces roseirectus]